MFINHLNTTAAELYQVEESFQRFDQKNNLMLRILWEEEIKNLEKIRLRNLDFYVKNNRPGYSKLDYAFLEASQKFLENIEYGINFCDQKANAWNGKKGIKCDGLDTVNLTKAIKKYAIMNGANAVGIAQLDRRWVYSHWFDKKTKKSYPLVFSDESKEYQNIDEPTLLNDGTRVIPANMKTVIVLLFEMDYECLLHSPTLLAFANSIHVYQKMSISTMSLAEFIREQGYNAIPSMNCTALNIPLAIDAGLGQLGRNGKLINPYLGSRFRICKVITDLPLLYDKPIDFGVDQFCDACRKCARECPVGAISTDKKTSIPVDDTGNPGYLRWAVDHKKCFKYWSECGTNCNICITVCSYNRGYKWTKNIFKSLNDNNALIDNLLNALDESELNFSPKKKDNFWLKD